MKKEDPLEILQLEDNKLDAELLRVYLNKQGLACSIMVVSKKEEFETALAERQFDVILSDFSIPGYNGEAALQKAQQLKPEIPFLFVSGTIGEEKAVEALRSGATDYILKGRLERLGSAIRRAVREKSERELRHQAEAARQELEERLRQAQKMEAVGQLAGGIAHDFNNLLFVIRGYTEMLLLTETEISGEGKESLKQVMATAQRASNLTRQLLTFSRKQPLAPKVLDLNTVVGELLNMLGRLLPRSIELQCDFAAALPPLYGDRGMLEQVLMNLVINARDAMPNGGRLILRTRKVAIKHSTVSTDGQMREGDFVCLEVCDNGHGISAEDLSRIFEPLFTTKKAGMGTGLGLATVYGIVKQHGGWVDVDSTVGKGTRFEVYFPMHGQETVEPPAEGGLTDVVGGSETILLAEDDETVRRLASRALQDLGYKVLQAESGKAALSYWQEEGGQIDLLLADLLLPDGLTGKELAEQLRQGNPRLQVVFTSGYPYRAGGTDTQFFRRSHFLQKPYTSRELGTLVRRCLDESRKDLPGT